MVEMAINAICGVISDLENHNNNFGANDGM